MSARGLGALGLGCILFLAESAQALASSSRATSSATATSSVGATSATSAEFRATLALRWAPIHHQDVHTVGRNGLGGAADFITAYDFDGDDDASNNWDNAGDPRFPLAAHAYYAVVETVTHWFITYTFYHPRDWSRRFLETEHENDTEGVMLAIHRDGSRFGALRAAVTVAHADFFSYLPEGSDWSQGQETVDGRLQLEPFDGELHPVTAQQAETHALKAWPYFRIHRRGVVYYPSLTRAEVPDSTDDRHVYYRLRDVLEPGGLWQKREQRELFARPGRMRGNRSGGCGRAVLWCVSNSARMPWSWDDHDDRLPAGAMAKDPARLVRSYFSFGESLARRYQFNPFR